MVRHVVALRVAILTCVLPAIGCWLRAETWAGEVPSPSATPCEVIVSGQTATLKSIVIKKVGQDVPAVFHGRGTCKNTPGFEWYVSQHYALKASVGDKLAERFLTLAELAHPFYVQVIGGEPNGIETTRMAIIHAKDLEDLQKAVKSDLDQPWVGGGGGVTLPGSFAAYNFPSGSLGYHRNDLSIHEVLHLQQLCVTGGFRTPLRFTEGITHAFANHVYDPKKQQLTVSVFDKAPLNNFVDTGLRLFRAKGVPEIEDVIREKTPKEYYAGLMTLYTQFFWTNPERLMTWRLWRDELFRARLEGKALAEFDLEVMKKLHGGSLDGLNQEWKAWVKQQHNTFTHIDWGWEQWGDTLQTYGWPRKDGPFSQMNINFAPGRKLPVDPLRLDYPRSPKPPILGAIRLGEDEPTVGCVVDFELAKNKGWAGVGLGVTGRDLMRVIVEQNKTLVMDGTLLKFKAGRTELAFTPKVLDAAQKTWRTGLTIKIARSAVEVVVRAGEGEGIQEMTASYPVSAEEREQLMTRYMALLSRDAKHELTPFIDEPPPPVDLTKPAPANRWRFAGEKETYGLCKAVWILGPRAPASLTALKKGMIAAMDKDFATQAQAMAAYRSQIAQVVQDVQNSGSPEARRALVEGNDIKPPLEPQRTLGPGK